MTDKERMFWKLVEEIGWGTEKTDIDDDNPSLSIEWDSLSESQAELVEQILNSK